MTEREKQILALIRENPLVSQKKLAEKLAITRSSVAVHIANLIKKGKIKGKGYVLDEEDYVVVIGASNMDIAGFSKQPLIFRDSNPGNIRMSSGGVGRNIAANLAKLGVKTKLLSVVGDDLFGRQLLDDTTRAGVDTNYTRIVPGIPSSVYLSVLNANGEMEAAVNAMSIVDALDIDWAKKHHHLIQNAAAVVVETNLPESTLRHLVTHYPQKLFLDTVSIAKAAKVKEIIGSFHTLKPNRAEAEFLTGLRIQTRKEVNRAIDYFLELGVTFVFISLGSEGTAYGTRHEKGRFKLKKAKSVNVTGAGDAFMACLVYGFLNELNLEETVRMASAASYLTLSSEETANPEFSLNQIQQTIQMLSL